MARRVVAAELIILGAVSAWALFKAPLPFIPALWRWPGVPESIHVRSRLADNLVASSRLVGMSASQVEALLGPPLHDGSPVPPAQMVYILGEQRSYMPIDSECLVLYMSASGRVGKAVVEAH